MSAEIYKKVLEDLNKGEEVAIVTKYNLKSKKIEKKAYKFDELDEETQKYESHEVVDKSFGGSLPKFLTAFFGDKKISKKEADELKKLIDSYKED